MGIADLNLIHLFWPKYRAGSVWTEA